MDPQSFYGLAGVPLVIALVQLVKVSDPEMPEHYYPAISLLVALIFNVMLALAIGSAIASAVLVGLITGLSASGLYSYSRVGK